MQTLMTGHETGYKIIDYTAFYRNLEAVVGLSLVEHERPFGALVRPAG
jgi:hypothetical protein